MNINTFKAKFNIGNNKDLAKAIMKRLAENNLHVNENNLDTYIEENSCAHIYVEGARTSFTRACDQYFFENHPYPEMTLNDLYHLKTHEITIDGETIEISAECLGILKKHLI